MGTVIDWEKIARAQLHPLRQDLIDEAYTHHLAGKRFSPSELAERLDEKLGNVSYHVRELHGQGILVEAGTAPVRGALQHYYKLSDKVLLGKEGR